MIAFFPSRTVVLELGTLTFTWYGLLYVIGFALALYILPRLQRQRDLKLTQDDWLYVLVLSMLGVLIGGRLGYVLLYNPGYFWQHLGEILAIWQGGMASHGGFIGAAVALWYAARKLHVSLLALLDVIVVPAAVGLALGRIGNFINQELGGVHGEPVQLYAVAKNVFIALCCWWYLTHTKKEPGKVAGLFLVLYSSLRFILEFWRGQEFPLWSLGGLALSRAQWFSIIFFCLGACLLARRFREAKRVD